MATLSFPPRDGLCSSHIHSGFILLALLLCVLLLRMESASFMSRVDKFCIFHVSAYLSFLGIPEVAPSTSPHYTRI